MRFQCWASVVRGLCSVSAAALTIVVLQLQRPNGSFQGDRWGETDTRFLYCAVSALAHLGALDQLDHEKTISWILRCANMDGGFGLTEGAESHAAQGTSGF